MAQKKPEANVFKDKSAISVAIATLVLLLLSFTAFRYINGNPGELNGNGLSDAVVEQSSDKQNDSTDEVIKNLPNNEQGGVGGAYSDANANASWMPTDYNKGDLKGDKHTVKSGDTLWEIADGYSGNGSNWVKIADANKVDYLSTGAPLIVPGQVLSIPSF